MEVTLSSQILHWLGRFLQRFNYQKFRVKRLSRFNLSEFLQC
jgi:hypothetical protein